MVVVLFGGCGLGCCPRGVGAVKGGVVMECCCPRGLRSVVHEVWCYP